MSDKWYNYDMLSGFSRQQWVKTGFIFEKVEMMRKTLLIVLATLFLVSESAIAAPTASHQAEKIVKGWLIRTKARPLGTPLGQMITRVDSFTDDKGEVIYYIIYLHPSGFVIVSADDLIEPIVGFASAGRYDPSLDNPLGALVTQDLKARSAVVRQAGKQGRLRELKSLENENKWRSLEYTGGQPGESVEMRVVAISDVRVAPLVQSRWDQTTVCGNNCYNLYTPNNYPCGCVATAMAQLMRYYQHPVGTYSWADMVLIPDCSTTLIQRQAIGTLCYDAGVAVNTDYGLDGSGANVLDAATAFVGTFNYGNAVKGDNHGNNIGQGLNGMLNPNLDAGCPCLLGIAGPPGGHAIVCDGYGYDSSTLYHHLNMGWSGISDAWYNLPNIDDTDVGNFNSVYRCVYNVYTAGSGEIISGRVTDGDGRAISDAAVTAIRNGGETYNATTNSKGIYALAKIPPNSTYTITVSKTGYSFASRSISTKTSTNNHNTSGNVWGADFEEGAKYGGGTGEPNDPYKIATPEDMQQIGANPSQWHKCFILVNDINLAEYTGTQFNRIGTDWDSAFTGVFDGNDHKIWNFTWTSDGIDYVGLFGYVSSGGQIKNLGIENADVNAINGDSVGGLVGFYWEGTISACYCTGSVLGSAWVGGLAGENWGGTISYCYSLGNVSGYDGVGGLAGTNVGTETVTNCYSSAKVSGNFEVGGLVGENWGGTISYCYSTGNATGTEYVGGLVGYDEESVVTASFWDVNTSGQSTSASGTPKTTAEMKTKSTFTDAGWDFVNVWDVCEGTNYPRLRWQIPLAISNGDLVCPYGVDLADFAILASAWQTKPNDAGWNPACDISQPKDNFINELDLAIFCENWLKER
jgi:hypothetical protein